MGTHLSLGIDHGCLTGDCPHDTANECVGSLQMHVEEIVREAQQLAVERDAARETNADWRKRFAALESLCSAVKAERDEARDVAQAFRDFGEFHHLHREYDLAQVQDAEAKLLAWQKAEQ